MSESADNGAEAPAARFWLQNWQYAFAAVAAGVGLLSQVINNAALAFVAAIALFIATLLVVAGVSVRD